MNNDEKMKHINDFISDIDCLEPLHEWTTDINIFSLLKLGRVEIRHSNMLAWLLNPNGTHGLRDKLLKKFLIYATQGTEITIMNGLNPVDVDLMDLDDVVIYREKYNIDILIVSENNQLVVAIENKIGANEHSNQLERYKNTLIKNYPNNYHFVLIYLTPDGKESSDVDNWISINYEFIVDELSNLVKIYKIPDKARNYLEDYIKIIRRSVVEDKEIADICKKIYFRHQEALDLIFEHKPDLQSVISDYIYDYLLNNAEKFDIKVWDNHTKHFVRFTPNQLVEKCGEMGHGWAKQSNLIGFEFQINEGVGISLSVIIGPALNEFEDYRHKILNVAKIHKYKMKNKELRDKWHTIMSTKINNWDELNIQDEFMEDTIGIKIDNYMRNTLPKIVHDLLEAFQ